MSAPKKILLPTTPEQFDELVSAITKKFGLPNEEHAAAVIANRIMHLPPDQATTTLEYLGHCVLKNMAYQVAQSKGRGIQHRGEVDQLIAQLTSDPLNQQARDALDKAAADGSEYAKNALSKLHEPAQNQEA